ncbi:cytochrome P450 [Bimuria novae-zelandiae CBS 107.79]|uniref:Cytochrome P450 n=1 Tax=Bimuria novae-zelandiae CBS 107.79 TaxID=1447943 RepID=A0A6A5UH66_9PLEO|nr:cytochrome P450 [Bimuria novae-zelandiae CBS 107.79]
MIATLLLSLFVAGLLYYVFSAIYYVTLHPLASLPGPRLCAISRIPYWYVSVQGVDVPWMKRLHDQYGPVVRFGPTDLSYASAQGWQEIHGAKVQEKAVEFAPQPVNGVAPMLTTKHENHVRMRRLFSPAFSARSLKAQEPLFKKYADLLMYTISEVGADGAQPIDLGRLLNFTTFDVMAELTFGHNLGMLAKNEYSSWVESIAGFLRMLPFVAMINYYPVLRTILFERFQPKWIREKRETHCNYAAGLVDERLRVGSKHPDVWNLVIKEEKGRGLTLEEMHSNAENFMLAGSETTATLLSGAVYNLLKDGRSYTLLCEEVRGAFTSADDMTLESLANLPYLTAVLKESLRIYPPVPIGSPRVIQSAGQLIQGTYIPAATRVSVHHWSTYHSSANFTSPDTFIPERFLSPPPAEFAGDAYEAFQPFGAGYRNCIGQGMAMHEMRLLLARLVWGWDVELGKESEGWGSQRSFALWIKPPLVVKARLRKR